jgi:hypothetical protein
MRLFMVVTFLFALLVAGTSRANAAVVLVLSTDNPDEDAAIQTTLQGFGHQVDIGASYWTFDGTDVFNYDVVVLVPNYNYNFGDMPDAGQMALVDFVNSGHGLVTAEWFEWMQGARGSFAILTSVVPVVATSAFGTQGLITYTSMTPDDILNTGVDSAFTFTADSIAGTDTSFVAKDGATKYYGSDYSDGAGGVIGWNVGAGRVISFSTVAGPMELGDANYSQLLSNAITWSTNPQ